MRTPFDDFTPEELEMLNTRKDEVGWDDESFSEVCLCGRCEECQHAIELVFQTTRTAESIETGDIPCDCKMPGNADAQMYELRRMFRL